MKTLITIVVISSFLFLLSCESQNQITDPSNQSEYSLNKKPDGTGKPNPSQPQVPIITLAINDVPIIMDNVETAPDGLITLNGNGTDTDKISLIVTSADGDPIKFVSVEMRYDADVSYSIRSNAEFGSLIYLKDYESFQNEDLTTSLVEVIDWDLTLMPIAEDPTYKGNFIVTNQLSTPDDGIPSASDHFYFRVSVETEDTWHSVRNWKWVANLLIPASTFHIAELCYRGNIPQNKRVSELYWEVLIHDEYCEPLQNAEAYHWSDAIPDGYNLGRALCLPSDNNGWAIIGNGGFTKRDFPYTIYIEGVQWYSGDPEQNMSVYNPKKNHDGESTLEWWSPSSTVSSLNDQADDCDHTHIKNF